MSYNTWYMQLDSWLFPQTESCVDSLTFASCVDSDEMAYNELSLWIDTTILFMILSNNPFWSNGHVQIQRWNNPLYIGVKELIFTVIIFTTVWTNSAEDKLMIIFLFYPQNRLWYFMQTVSLTVCMKCQILFSGKNKKKYFKMSSAEKLPSIQFLTLNFEQVI